VARINFGLAVSASVSRTAFAAVVTVRFLDAQTNVTRVRFAAVDFRFTVRSSVAFVTVALVITAWKIIARAMVARIWPAVVDWLVAVGAGVARLTLARIAVHFVVTGAVHTRVTRALVNLDFTVLASVARVTATFIRAEV